MHSIPKKLRAELAKLSLYKFCLRQAIFKDHECAPDPRTGKLIEWEHVWIYAGRQIQARWAIIPICWWAHRGGGLDKSKNEYLSIMRASDEDLFPYPRIDWRQKKFYLIKKYKDQI